MAVWWLHKECLLQPFAFEADGTVAFRRPAILSHNIDASVVPLRRKRRQALAIRVARLDEVGNVPLQTNSHLRVGNWYDGALARAVERVGNVITVKSWVDINHIVVGPIAESPREPVIVATEPVVAEKLQRSHRAVAGIHLGDGVGNIVADGRHHVVAEKVFKFGLIVDPRRIVLAALVDDITEQEVNLLAIEFRVQSTTKHGGARKLWHIISIHGWSVEEANIGAQDVLSVGAAENFRRQLSRLCEAAGIGQPEKCLRPVLHVEEGINRHITRRI